MLLLLFLLLLLHCSLHAGRGGGRSTQLRPSCRSEWRRICCCLCCRICCCRWCCCCCCCCCCWRIRGLGDSEKTRRAVAGEELHGISPSYRGRFSLLLLLPRHAVAREETELVHLADTEETAGITPIWRCCCCGSNGDPPSLQNSLLFAAAAIAAAAIVAAAIAAVAAAAAPQETRGFEGPATLQRWGQRNSSTSGSSTAREAITHMCSSSSSR